jgi:hypothetical protein
MTRYLMATGKKNGEDDFTRVPLRWFVNELRDLMIKKRYESAKIMLENASACDEWVEFRQSEKKP